MAVPLKIQRESLLQKLAADGSVLLRGYKTDLAAFSDLVEQVSPKTAIDPARAFFAKNVQLVDSGVQEIGLHCENGTTPLVPTLVWFYCQQAAALGSQTTLCDGREVWARLSARAQALFLSKRVRFSRNVKAELWIKYVKHHIPSLANQAEITQEQLDGAFAHIDGAELRLNADGSLFLSHAAYLAHPTHFGPGTAFANSIFGPSFNYEAPKIQFENGDEIPAWALDEARTIAEQLTVNVDWISGDILLIDNTRVMHGRRAITDTRRRIFTALGFCND